MQKIKDNLGLIFISLVTILYLWIACNLVINFEEVKALDLNEKGDFLAGIFSPLAFLWLVYGYLQQGQELKQNTDALKLQAHELKNSVEQQKQLVEVTQAELQIIKNKDDRQIKLETIQAQPYFHFPKHEMKLHSYFHQVENLEMYKLVFQFSNSRAICRKLEIRHETDELNLPDTYLAVPITEIELVSTDHKNLVLTDVDLSPYLDTNSIDISIVLKFSYLDLYDKKQSQKFRIRLRKKQENDDAIFWGYTTIHQIDSTYNS